MTAPMLEGVTANYKSWCDIEARNKEAQQKEVQREEVQREEENKTAINQLLSAALSGWQFDAFALAKLTGNKPLSTLGNYLFCKLGFVDHFQLNRERLAQFFVEIEQGYDDEHLYHNRTHAASVLHMMHAILTHGGVAQAVLLAFASGEPSSKMVSSSGQLERMACLLAAAMHDYEHKGVNNDFLVKTQDDRALQYNDHHVNENHHAAASFAVLRRPQCNFLTQLPSSDFKRLRGLVIGMIISTDMADSNQLVKSFTEATAATPVSSSQPFAPASAKEALLALQIAIKCADVGHLALGWGDHVLWVQRLEQEFFAQGDREQALGMPELSFLMDREKPGVTQTQSGFFNFVALPLFRTLAGAFPMTAPMLEAVTANYTSWCDLEAAKVKAREDAAARAWRQQQCRAIKALGLTQRRQRRSSNLLATPGGREAVAAAAAEIAAAQSEIESEEVLESGK